MNRNILIAVSLLSLGGGQPAVAQETNSSVAPPRISLQALMQKNIFDPSRSGGRSSTRTVRPRAAVVRSFTFRGTIDDIALFTGDGAGKGYFKVDDLINGFKIRKIPVEYLELPNVVLTDPNGAVVVLKEDESMRREENGPWTKSDEPALLVITNPEVKGNDSPASSNPAPAGESDILKKLRLKREQEDK
jgi:hypothetical protein